MASLIDDCIRDRASASHQHRDVRVVAGMVAWASSRSLFNDVRGINAESIEAIVAICVGSPFSSEVRAGRGSMLGEGVSNVRAVPDGPYFRSQG